MEASCQDLLGKDKTQKSLMKQVRDTRQDPQTSNPLTEANVKERVDRWSLVFFPFGLSLFEERIS